MAKKSYGFLHSPDYDNPLPEIGRNLLGHEGFVESHIDNMHYTAVEPRLWLRSEHSLTRGDIRRLVRYLEKASVEMRAQGRRNRAAVRKERQNG